MRILSRFEFLARAFEIAANRLSRSEGNFGMWFSVTEDPTDIRYWSDRSFFYALSFPFEDSPEYVVEIGFYDGFIRKKPMIYHVPDTGVAANAVRCVLFFGKRIPYREIPSWIAANTDKWIEMMQEEINRDGERWLTDSLDPGAERSAYADYIREISKMQKKNI